MTTVRAANVPTVVAGIPRCPHGAPLWACRDITAFLPPPGDPLRAPSTDDEPMLRPGEPGYFNQAIRRAHPTVPDSTTARYMRGELTTEQVRAIHALEDSRRRAEAEGWYDDTPEPVRVTPVGGWLLVAVVVLLTLLAVVARVNGWWPFGGAS